MTYVFEGKLKYDLHVLKGSNHKKIKLKYSGHEDMYLKKGNLIITTSVNTVTELKPVSYQLIQGNTVYVKCNYKLLNNIVLCRSAVNLPVKSIFELILTIFEVVVSKNILV